MPKSQKVAARWVARVNVTPDAFGPRNGLLTAMNRAVAGYLEGEPDGGNFPFSSPDGDYHRDSQGRWIDGPAL